MVSVIGSFKSSVPIIIGVPSWFRETLVGLNIIKLPLK